MSSSAMQAYFKWLQNNPDAVDNRPGVKIPVITDLTISQARLATLGVEFPDAFYKVNGELQIVVSGTVPAVVSNWKGFDCITIGGYKYLLFCPKGVNGASKDFGDHGTWEGPKARTEASKAASEQWLAWVGNPAG